MGGGRGFVVTEMSVTVLKMHHGVVPKEKTSLKMHKLEDDSLIVLNVSAKYRSKKISKNYPNV